MKAEYCFEYALLTDSAGNYRYELAGIWAFDPATLDLDCLHLPGYEDLEQRAMLKDQAAKEGRLYPWFFKPWTPIRKPFLTDGGKGDKED